MSDFRASSAGSPCNMFRQTLVYMLGRRPDGPVADFSYISAKIYRYINNAARALPALKGSPRAVESSRKRVPIALVKSEVEELIRSTSLSSRETPSAREPEPSIFDFASGEAVKPPEAEFKPCVFAAPPPPPEPPTVVFDAMQFTPDGDGAAVDPSFWAFASDTLTADPVSWDFTAQTGSFESAAWAFDPQGASFEAQAAAPEAQASTKAGTSDFQPLPYEAQSTFVQHDSLTSKPMGASTGGGPDPFVLQPSAYDARLSEFKARPWGKNSDDLYDDYLGYGPQPSAFRSRKSGRASRSHFHSSQPWGYGSQHTAFSSGETVRESGTSHPVAQPWEFGSSFSRADTRAPVEESRAQMFGAAPTSFGGPSKASVTTTAGTADDSCVISFDFAGFSAAPAGGSPPAPSAAPGGLPPDMDEFMELMMSCANEMSPPF